MDTAKLKVTSVRPSNLNNERNNISYRNINNTDHHLEPVHRQQSVNFERNELNWSQLTMLLMQNSQNSYYRGAD